MLKTRNLEELFSLLEEMTQSKTNYPKVAPPLIMQRFGKYSMRGFVFTASMFLVLAILLVRWQYLGITSPLGLYVLLIVNLILLVFAIVYVMTVVATVWWDGKQYFPAMLSALKKDLHLDEKFITRLLRFDKETLAYGLLQYRYRWSFAEGRIVLISGELRKLGIFPALAALIISSATLSKEFLIFVIATASLYVLALYVLDSLERPKQVIQLLEYAIQHAENPTRSHLMPITSPPSA
jgi:hypothetical protein